MQMRDIPRFKNICKSCIFIGVRDYVRRNKKVDRFDIYFCLPKEGAASFKSRFGNEPGDYFKWPCDLIIDRALMLVEKGVADARKRPSDVSGSERIKEAVD